MQLGQMIAKIRKEQGMTQETFAKKFDVTRQTVSNWENEKSYPDLHTLIKISDEFNLSLDVLLKGDTTMVKDIDKKIKLLVKYDDKHNIDKVISALNIKSWKETEKSIGMNPKYTIKFYCDTTNQDEEKDIKEITLYENGEYATIFITSPGGVKQNYKTSIDISELVI